MNHKRSMAQGVPLIVGDARKNRYASRPACTHGDDAHSVEPLTQRLQIGPNDVSVTDLAALRGKPHQNITVVICQGLFAAKNEILGLETVYLTAQGNDMTLLQGHRK